MTKEIEKAIRKGEKNPNRLVAWWEKNNYKVYCVIFFPVSLAVLAKRKIDKIKIARKWSIKWNEERADKILNYYIPRKSYWDKDLQAFSFSDNGWGWDIDQAKKYLKRKDRKFWDRFTTYKGGQIRDYLIENFQLEGFTKEIACIEKPWTIIIFHRGVDK